MRRAIIELAKQNIIRGYDDGTFRPFNLVTRAHFVTFIMRTPGHGDAELHYEGANFKDFTPNVWCCKAVMNAHKMGLVKGFGENCFGRNDIINSTQIYIVAGRVLHEKFSYKIPNNYRSILEDSYAGGFQSYSAETQKRLTLSAKANVVVNQKNLVFDGSACLYRGNAAVVPN